MLEGASVVDIGVQIPQPNEGRISVHLQVLLVTHVRVGLINRFSEVWGFWAGDPGGATA